MFMDTPVKIQKLGTEITEAGPVLEGTLLVPLVEGIPIRLHRKSKDGFPKDDYWQSSYIKSLKHFPIKGQCFVKTKNS